MSGKNQPPVYDSQKQDSTWTRPENWRDTLLASILSTEACFRHLKRVCDFLFSMAHFWNGMHTSQWNLVFLFWPSWGKVSPSKVRERFYLLVDQQWLEETSQPVMLLVCRFGKRWCCCSVLGYLAFLPPYSPSFQIFHSDILKNVLGFPGKWKGINLFNFLWKRRKRESCVWTSLTHSSGACLAKECSSSSWWLSHLWWQWKCHLPLHFLINLNKGSGSPLDIFIVSGKEILVYPLIDLFWHFSQHWCGIHVVDCSLSAILSYFSSIGECGEWIARELDGLRRKIWGTHSLASLAVFLLAHVVFEK